MDRKWRFLKGEDLVVTPYFVLEKRKYLLPNKKVVPDYYVLDYPEWVHIVPVNEKNEIILISQYRPAGDLMELEFPGGAAFENRNEEPSRLAERELLEETGYFPENLELLGIQYPNPATHTNRLHTFLATGCKKVADQRLDPQEEIEVHIVNKDELLDIVKEGKFNNSLMLASLMLALDHLV